MKSIANVTTTDVDTDTTVEQPGTVRVNLEVNNAAIAYVLGTGWPPSYPGPAITWRGPGLWSLDRACSGIRVRSFAVGVPAKVAIELMRPEDLP